MQRLNDMPTSELIKTAHAYSGSIKEVGIYSELVKELTNRLDFSTTATSQALAERSELRREVTALDSSVTNLESKLLQLIGENAYLLPKAASELSNAWVLNKYWVGIHAALMHVRESRLHDGMVWLQNTVAGPGIEVPQLSEFAEIEAWAVEQQKDSISAARALEIIKAETPATDTALAEIRAQGVDLAIEHLTKKFEGTGGVGVPVMALEHLASELRKEQGK